MKRKKKILLVLSILVLFIFVRTVMDAYAKYAHASSTNSNANYKMWHITINDQDIENNKVIDLDGATIFTDEDFIQFFSDDVLSPGNFGYFEMEIDYTEVQVPFVYDIFVSSNTNNTNIITVTRTYDTLPTDAEVKADIVPLFNSMADIGNPIKGSVGVDDTPRVKYVRVYVLWKEDIDDSNGYIDGVTTNEGIDYDITLYFRQDVDPVVTPDPDPELPTPDPDPEPVVYGLEIEGRTNIIDNDSDGFISFGDVIKLKTSDSTFEEFYVMEVDETSNTVKMLAKNNLNIYASNEDDRIQSACPDDTCNLKFYNHPQGKKIGYWSGHFFDSEALNVYNDKSNLYNYLENYKRILESHEYTIFSISPPSYNDILKACGGNSLDCNSPSWLVDSSYWTASASYAFNMWTVTKDPVSMLGNSTHLNSLSKADSNKYGVRPQIIMYAKDIY